MNTSERIKEIAIKISPDYPDIANCDDFECLWAIARFNKSYGGTLWYDYSGNGRIKSENH